MCVSGTCKILKCHSPCRQSGTAMCHIVCPLDFSVYARKYFSAADAGERYVSPPPTKKDEIYGALCRKEILRDFFCAPFSFLSSLQRRIRIGSARPSSGAERAPSSPRLEKANEYGWRLGHQIGSDFRRTFEQTNGEILKLINCVSGDDFHFFVFTFFALRVIFRWFKANHSCSESSKNDSALVARAATDDGFVESNFHS